MILGSCWSDWFGEEIFVSVFRFSIMFVMVFFGWNLFYNFVFCCYVFLWFLMIYILVMVFLKNWLIVFFLVMFLFCFLVCFWFGNFFRRNLFLGYKFGYRKEKIEICVFLIILFIFVIDMWGMWIVLFVVGVFGFWWVVIFFGKFCIFFVVNEFGL